MFPLPPVAFRVVGLLAIAAALFGGGFWLGGQGPHAELEAFKAKTQAAAAVQTVKNEAVASKGADISKTVGVEYAKGNFDLRRVYGAGRVLHADLGSRKASSVSGPSSGTDGGSSDGGLGAGQPTPGPDECAALRSDAAIATRQFLFLRDWLEQQADAWRTLSDTSRDSPATNEP